MTALILLADGCEELEAISIIDVLRRGGVQVRTASTTGSEVVHGAHGIDIGADSLFDETAVCSFDLVAFPGGMGCMRALRADGRVLAALRAAVSSGKFVGAVCASPAVLGAAGLLENRRYVCYPGIEAEITNGEFVPGEATLRDGPIITGTGPGTASLFALALLEALAGRAVRDQVAKAMLIP